MCGVLSVPRRIIWMSSMNGSFLLTLLSLLRNAISLLLLLLLPATTITLCMLRYSSLVYIAADWISNAICIFLRLSILLALQCDLLLLLSITLVDALLLGV